jgi:hypothetical protein
LVNVFELGKKKDMEEAKAKQKQAKFWLISKYKMGS